MTHWNNRWKYFLPRPCLWFTLMGRSECFLKSLRVSVLLIGLSSKRVWCPALKKVTASSSHLLCRCLYNSRDLKRSGHIPENLRTVFNYSFCLNKSLFQSDLFLNWSTNYVESLKTYCNDRRLNGTNLKTFFYIFRIITPVHLYHVFVTMYYLNSYMH